MQGGRAAKFPCGRTDVTADLSELCALEDDDWKEEEQSFNLIYGTPTRIEIRRHT